MQQLLRLFWEICLLRKGPQDVPAAPVLFWLLLLVGLLVDLIIAVNFVDLESALLVVLANTVALFGVVVALLYLLGYRSRAIQTLITLMGTGLIFSAIRLPLMFLLRLLPGGGGMFGFVEIFVLVWSLVVIAHILRHALSIHLFMAGVLAFGYFMLSYQLVNYFIPQAG